MSAIPPRLHFSFWRKAVFAVLLIALADAIIGGGSVLGVCALAWTIATVASQRALCRHAGAKTAVVAALLLGAALFEQPGPLAAVLFWTALTTAVLLPRARFGDAWSWSSRLVAHALGAIVGPLRDLRRLRRLKTAKGRPGPLRWIPILALPVAGSLVFLGLFAAANPLISAALDRVRLPDMAYVIGHGPLWLLTLMVVWATLRPRALLRPRPSPAVAAKPRKVGRLEPGLLSVTLSLMVFNAVFALQNGLDIAFLWSGAPLPEGVTLADYAHRGAYPLIATALLAGAFVLIVLKPGSPGAAQPLVRRLVTLWVAQNILLVASSIYRTLDYIEVYSLTRLRLAALLWMALVAVGLFLICWRLLRGRSGAWLINANGIAALAVLSVCTVADLGAVSAAWNVRHAREAGGKGTALDVCYLNSLGSSALVSLVELEQRRLPPDLADRVAWLRDKELSSLEQSQSHRRSWTWRGARRLDRAKAIGLHRPGPIQGWAARDCAGVIPPVPPLPTPAPAPTPLTQPAGAQ